MDKETFKKLIAHELMRQNDISYHKKQKTIDQINQDINYIYSAIDPPYTNNGAIIGGEVYSEESGITMSKKELRDTLIFLAKKRHDAYGYGLVAFRKPSFIERVFFGSIINAHYNNYGYASTNFADLKERVKVIAVAADSMTRTEFCNMLMLCGDTQLAQEIIDATNHWFKVYRLGRPLRIRLCKINVWPYLYGAIKDA